MIQPQAGAATVDGHDFRTIFQNQRHRHRADIPLPILFGEAEAVRGIVAQALVDARLQAGIDQSLRDYAAYGFCLSEQDWQRDISAVAMPLILEDGAEVMAINCGGSSLRLDHDRLVNNLGPRLKEVAARIKQELAPKYGASR